MKVFVAIEQHFVEYDGGIYTDIAFSYDYWKEYLQVFDHVNPIARVRKVDSLPTGWQRADGKGVKFVKIRDYLGFWDFLKKTPIVLRDCFRATKYEGCYLLRMGNIATFCWFWLWCRRKPYAVEVVGHVGESVLLVKNVQKFGLARLIALVNHTLTKIQAKSASCASYTSRYIQEVYPSLNNSNEWVFSSVKLDQQVIAAPRGKQHFLTKPVHIVSVGRLEPEKGHAVLVDALANLNKTETNFTAKIIGPGREIDNLRHQVSESGLAGKVQVSPAIPWGSQLFEEFDKAQLFILPSITESMPRALIEAMARGLPAIGSDTGGIKELLNKEYLVPPNDSKALAEKIAQVINDPEKLEAMSRANFEKALEYRPEIMNQRKMRFWQFIKNNCN
jgi:glycosyltransferase involved in cell wall biosynthesis